MIEGEERREPSRSLPIEESTSSCPEDHCNGEGDYWRDEDDDGGRELIRFIGSIVGYPRMFYGVERLDRARWKERGTSKIHWMKS